MKHAIVFQPVYIHLHPETDINSSRFVPAPGVGSYILVAQSDCLARRWKHSAPVGGSWERSVWSGVDLKDRCRNYWWIWPQCSSQCIFYLVFHYNSLECHFLKAAHAVYPGRSSQAGRVWKVFLFQGMREPLSWLFFLKKWAAILQALDFRIALIFFTDLMTGESCQISFPKGSLTSQLQDLFVENCLCGALYWHLLYFHWIIEHLFFHVFPIQQCALVNGVSMLCACCCAGTCPKIQKVTS